MSGDVHVRFCEHLGGRFPGVTRLVILCPRMEDAQQALQELRSWVEANGLHLHPEKTRVEDCRQPWEVF